jgi:hypothetical protein
LFVYQKKNPHPPNRKTMDTAPLLFDPVNINIGLLQVYVYYAQYLLSVYLQESKNPCQLCINRKINQHVVDALANKQSMIHSMNAYQPVQEDYIGLSYLLKSKYDQWTYRVEIYQNVDDIYCYEVDASFKVNNENIETTFIPRLANYEDLTVFVKFCEWFIDSKGKIVDKLKERDVNVSFSDMYPTNEEHIAELNTRWSRWLPNFEVHFVKNTNNTIAAHLRWIVPVMPNDLLYNTKFKLTPKQAETNETRLAKELAICKEEVANKLKIIAERERKIENLKLEYTLYR